MEYFLYQLAYQDSKVPKHLVVKCSVLSLLTATGPNKTTPLHFGTSYIHPRCSVNVSATHQIAWAESQKPKVSWAVRGLYHFQPPLMGTFPLKFPLYSLFRPKGSKTIKSFSRFHGFIPDTNYKHLKCFAKLGTHSELHRGEMSQYVTSFL